MVENISVVLVINDSSLDTIGLHDKLIIRQSSKCIFHLVIRQNHAHRYFVVCVLA